MRVRIRRGLAAGVAAVALTAGMAVAGATSASAQAETTSHFFTSSTKEGAIDQAINYVNVTDPNCWFAGVQQSGSVWVAEARCPY